MNLNPRIIAAFLVGTTLVAGSFILSKNKEVLSLSSDTSKDGRVEREFIEINDSDQNSVPDWQESFAAATVDLDEIATSSKPTLTGNLVSMLASRTMSGNYTNSSEVTAEIGAELTKQSLDEQYEPSDIIIVEDNSPSSLRAYGNAVAIIAKKYPLPKGTRDELTVLNSAFLKDDPEVLKELDPTIAAYEGMLKDMLATPVPSSLVREHLSLINVYNALLIDVQAFRNTFSDALTAMLRFRRYTADTEALYIAISSLYLSLNESGIKWTDGDAASRFIKIE